jgi:hypothetical protein
VTSFDQITFLAPTEESEARFFGYDSFVARLKEVATVPVVVLPDDGTVPEARGPILLNRHGAAVKQRGSANLDDLIAVFKEVWPEPIRPLLFCLNAERGDDALTLLDSLRLSGSVDLHDYRIGLDPERMGKGPHNQSGLYGLRDAVTSIGGSIEFEKGRYCKTTCAPFPDLPSLLVAYFDAYWQIAKP